ncbi:MAG: hypothetical protein U1E05_03750 [Patescibacteria group bacterium]|nr:hypothetical protein [Patescibacteria group bacterium]
MARENQGLQVAMIIFVILTIILGVTTFIFFKQGEDSELRAKEAEKSSQEKNQLAYNVIEENNRLKELMGLAQTLKIDEVSDEVNKDLSVYAANFRSEPRGYRQALAYLYQSIQGSAVELELAKVEVQEWKDKIPTLEVAKAKQVDQHKQMVDSKQEELAAEQAKIRTDRSRFTNDTAELTNVVKQAREQSAQNVQVVNRKLDDTNKRVQGLVKVVKDQAGQLGKLQQGTFEVPDGEIRWVNQKNRTVWINRGRADSLLRQTSFAVYPGDATAMGKDNKKASIEVTQILGDNLAEARIVHDSSTDPIMPGDKIHTPVWSVGDRRRFALVGFLDATGDGRDDLQMIRNLIAANGGVVDAVGDAAGNREGQITVNTRYLVLGERPDEKGKAGAIAVFTRMVGDAERLGVQTIPLGQLLEMMGWQNRTPVERLTDGSAPQTLRSRDGDGAPRTSTGSVSELFRPRTPPRGLGGAY